MVVNDAEVCQRIKVKLAHKSCKINNRHEHADADADADADTHRPSSSPMSKQQLLSYSYLLSQFP